MSCQSGAQVESPPPPPQLAPRQPLQPQQQEQQHQHHRSRQSEEFDSAVAAVISRIQLDRAPSSVFESAQKPPLPAAVRESAEFPLGETQPPRNAAALQVQLDSGSPWENPSAHSTADNMILSPTTSFRQSPFSAPLARPSSAGSSRGGSSRASGRFRATALLAEPRGGDPFTGDASPVVSIPLTHTHTQKQRWPDSHGAQTLSAWLQRTSSSGSGSGSEGHKSAQDHSALQRCASAPHERGAGGNSDGARGGGGVEAAAAALQPGGGLQLETEEERSFKRRLLNREYAKRSRQRQHERFVELEAQVNSLAADKRASDQRLQEMEQALMILQAENARLRQIAAGRYSRDMAEILRAIQQAGGLSSAGGLSAIGLPPQTGGARIFSEAPRGAASPASAGAAAAARAALGLNASARFDGTSAEALAEIETAIGGNGGRGGNARSGSTWQSRGDVNMMGGYHDAPPATRRESGAFPPPPPSQAAPSVQDLFGQIPLATMGDRPSRNFHGGGDESEMMIFAAAAASAANTAAPATAAPAAPASMPAENRRSFESFAIGGQAGSGAFSGAFSTAPDPSFDSAYSVENGAGFAGFATGGQVPAIWGANAADFSSAGFGAAGFGAAGDDDTAALLAVAGLVGGNGGGRGGGEMGQAGRGVEEVGGSGRGGVGQGSGGEWREHEEDTLFAMIHHLHRQL
ncbi:hypothetical protein CLOM_g22739 [Closterium sp. NIES-68]|nr:hypothetical protein CLOM_g22739 [Closterium sp. NIES-68]GJP60551.1 hypothetical protein CLOP_g17792 [Closterium sp. NIES-67]